MKDVDDFSILGIMTIAVLLIWPLLEMKFYGEAQPRRVDNIITACWMAEVAITYFLGYRRGRKHK